MRNISIQREVKRSLYKHRHDENNHDDRIVYLCCVDSDDIDDGSIGVLTKNGYVYLADSNDNVLWEINLNDLVSIDNTDTTRSDDVTNNIRYNTWFNLTYVEPYLIALNHNGSIVSILNGVHELVGEFENGILMAGWNIDRSVLLLVTSISDTDDDEENDGEQNGDNQQNRRQSVLLSLNNQWDVLSEVHIDRIDEEHGVSICCTNGQFAVNSVDYEDKIRKIRIYSSDTLDLHAIGRTEDGSGKLVPNLQYSNIAWANSGCSNLLTAIQTKGRKTLVAFFEPNGLRHREFVIRDDNDTVTGLQWNSKSDILAVSLQQKNSLVRKVQLWHRSNYYWYIKYEFRYEQELPLFIKFHETYPYLLYVYNLQHLRFQVIHLRWDVSTKHSATTALSIDGSLLNMTDFERSFVPPPIYDYTLTMDVPIHEVTTSRTESTSVYGVLTLSDSTFVILHRDDEKAKYPSVGKAATFRTLQEHFDLSTLRHLTFIYQDETQIFLVAVSTSWKHTGVDFLLEILITGEDAVITGSHQLDQYCLSISAWLDISDTGALIQLQNGTLLEYTLSSTDESTFRGTIISCAVENLLEPCPRIQCHCIHDNSHTQSSRLVIGMSSNGRLYCNDFQIADSISSFTVSLENQFLCYATAGSGCVLRFIPLQDLINFDPLLGADENSILLGYEPRNIERKSLLVSVLTKKPSVVLQMDRGNLEIIHPRALVLRHAMIETMNMQYKEAFELMRRQKVDLNLIVDLNPLHFLENGGVEAFVEQVETIDYLNLFISCLQDSDSTKERYPIPHWIKSTQSEGAADSTAFSGKVNHVCNKMRTVMSRAQYEGRTVGGRLIKEDHFLLPILSTFAKENPPKLEDALSLIRDNANKTQCRSSMKPALFADTAQSSIQYLAFMADYELLFQTALGLYDYDMARAVARNSQMDPKVYLPLLQYYRGLPKYYGRHQVDMKLKRYESALRNLFDSKTNEESVNIEDVSDSKGNNFVDILHLIEEHKLHRIGLELCSDKEQRTSIFQSLGNQLLMDKKPQTALMVFLSSEEVNEEQCLRAAKECQDWSTLFSLPMIRNDAQRRERLAWEVADDLAAHAEGNTNKSDLLGNASRVLLDYGNDLGGAVKMLIKGELWSEANRIAILHNRDDLARKVVDAAVSFAQHTVADLEDRAESFREASARYNEVLKIRKEAMRNSGVEDVQEIDAVDDASLFSAVSNASNLSIRSTASVGSTTSLSSVISVKSSNSFSLTGGEDSNRHKSKYNVLGGQKSTKTKKKKPKGRKKIHAGSEEDLLGLVQTLKSNLVDENLRLKIGDTITFLIQNGHFNVAKAIFESYDGLMQAISVAKTARATNKHIFVENRVDNAMDCHKVEAEVEALECVPLSSNVLDIFSNLP